MESRATSSLPGPASDWEPNELPVPMPQAPRAPAIRYSGAGHALDLQRPLGVVRDDVGEPVEAAEERQERHDREDEEAGEGVERAPAGLRDDQHQREQQARRELERDADAQRGAGRGGVAPRQEEQAGGERERHRHVVAVGGDRPGGEDGDGEGGRGRERALQAAPEGRGRGAGERRRRGGQQDHLRRRTSAGTSQVAAVRRQREQRQRQRRVLEREVLVDAQALRRPSARSRSRRPMSETSKKWYSQKRYQGPFGSRTQVLAGMAPGPARTQQPEQEHPHDGLERDRGDDDQRRLARRPRDGPEQGRLRAPAAAPARARRRRAPSRSPARQPRVDLAAAPSPKSVSGRHSSPSCCAALGQVAAREHQVGLARGAHVAGPVAEHEDDVAGAAQPVQDRRLAALRAAARAVAERAR